LAAAGDQELGAQMVRTLDQLLGVDPIGYAIVLDMLRGEFEVGRWCASLGCSEPALGDRRYLALYRYAVIFHDVLAAIPDAPRAALAARRFARANQRDEDAFAATCTAMGTHLSLGDWRQLYREGAFISLTLLARPEALGLEACDALEGAFRRVLGIEDGGP
jgi:hypothetical protein